MASKAAQDNDRILDLVSSLGCDEDSVYVTGPECLDCLEALEVELYNDDSSNHDGRIQLGQLEIVKKHFIPILIHSKDSRICAIIVKLLVNLTMPVECLLPTANLMGTQTLLNQLQFHLLAAVNSFLVSASTLCLVTSLRDEITKTERHQIPMSTDNCEHLRNCLLLLRNVLYCPGQADAAAYGISREDYHNWQSVQSKLVWNLFVQGLDGALLLMLNSRYKEYWTEPLAQIITLLYKDQNASKVQQSLELISSTSESSGDDEESDGSKHSSASLSSDTPKLSNTANDSGCPFSPSSLSNEDTDDVFKQKDPEKALDDSSVEIDAKLKSFNIQDSDEDISMEHASDYSTGSEEQTIWNMESNTQLLHTSYPSPFTETDVPHQQMHLLMDDTLEATTDSTMVISDNKKSTPSANKHSSLEEIGSSSKMPQRNSKACHKHRNSHSHLKFSESDSSNEDVQDSKSKVRMHLPMNWKGKSLNSKRTLGCAPSVCLEAAVLNHSNNWGRLKYPLWEKRGSITHILDHTSQRPSVEDIGNLLKNFTLSFLQSGFKNIVVDLMNLHIAGDTSTIDKSHLCWLLSYFLQFTESLNLNIKHLNDILSAEVIGYLTYESIMACEEMEMNIRLYQQVPNHLLRCSHLLVSALKEVIATIHGYINKAISNNDRTFFHKLCCNLAEMVELRQLPLLLHHTYHPSFHSKQYLEDLVILNHHLLLLIEKVSNKCWKPKKMNIHSHLRQFATQTVVSNYGRLLEAFNTNSPFVNDCVFTMLHHLAGDVNASELLLQSSILKTFSNILKEDIALPQFWEDLIMYILNKFSQRVGVQKLKSENEGTTKKYQGNSCCSSEVGVCIKSGTSSSSVLSKEEGTDELFWWYLQFEAAKDPIAKIAEHTMISELEILQRLHTKGIISYEKYKELDKIAKQKDSEEMACQMVSESVVENYLDDDIPQLLRKLVQSGYHQHLAWIQDQLLEVCYVKCGIEDHAAEPISYYSYRMLLNVPLVPYSDDQRAVLQDKVFLTLLRKLGFLLEEEPSKLYPRIPIFWSSETLYNITTYLGPVKKEKLEYLPVNIMHSNTRRPNYSINFS